MKHIPNILTSLRLLFSIPIVILINNGEFQWAALLFLIIIPTDIFDGMLARRLNIASSFGGFLDALSDKILIYVTLFSLYRFEAITYMILMPLFFRDMFVDALRSYAAKKTNVLSANWSGKMKFLAQCLSAIAGLAFLYFNDTMFYYIANILLAAAFLFSLPGAFIITKNALTIIDS